MKVRYLLSLLLLVLPSLCAASSNPIPGVGIVVKRPPGSSTAFVAPAGFFGAGSAAFAASVPMEGRCSHDCGGCDNNCATHAGVPDSRFDYASSSSSGPFDMSMQSTTLYSTSPIKVSVNGVDRFFHVFVTISGPGAAPDDPIPGTFTLPPGQSLDLGAASTVASSSLDLHATTTFEDATTGIAAGSSIEQDVHLVLQEPNLPVARVANGTPSGAIVLGSDGSSAVRFNYASPGGLLISCLSLDASSPVASRSTTWGAIKTHYR